LIKKGISAIPTILSTDYLYGFEKGVFSGPVYRPASLIMFDLEWNLFPDNPHIFHFMNVLLFAITCWILFLLLCRLFESRMGGTFSLIFPFICTLLYAAHPIHTEVVDNIKSRDEILCFLFGVLAIFAFIKAISKESLLYLIPGCVCFFISLLSKETGITFLVIIPLTAYVFTDISARKLVVISITVLITASIYFIIREYVLHSIRLNTSDTYLYDTVVAAPNFISRQATVFYIFLRYILLLIFPYNLTCDYNLAMIKVQTLRDLPAIIGIIINLGIGVYALLNIRKKSVISYAILFYFITLAPVSNMFIFNGATMAERFMYTPSLGFCIILSYFIIRLIKTKSADNKIETLYDFFSMNSRLFIVVFSITFLYSVKVFSRTIDWQDNATIYAHDVETSDNSATAHIAWGKELYLNLAKNEKNPDLKKSYLNKAVIEFTKALTIMDTLKFPSLYNDKGCALAEAGRYDEAIISFQKEINLSPKLEEQLDKNIGSVYANLKQYSKALEYFNKAVELNPSDIQVYNYIGMSYNSLGDSLKANEYFERATRIIGGQSR
jgi:tetratricopeptide (TPR) repeat protein